MKLLDTNIIIYAVGREHSYKASCAYILDQVALGSGEYTVDVETLQEVLYVYMSRGERAFGLSIFDDALILFPNPVPIGRAELLIARQLLEGFPRFSPCDAIHAAVVLTQRLEGIVSTDKVFGEVPGITAFDPLDLSP